MTERIHSLWDYYDCPRSGITGFENDVCYFECEWDAEADDYSKFYAIKKLNEEIVELVREYDEIWNNWHAKFISGKETIKTHPANEGQSSRFCKLQNKLESAIERQSVIARRIPEFSVCDGQENLPVGVTRKMEVVWKTVT